MEKSLGYVLTYSETRVNESNRRFPGGFFMMLGVLVVVLPTILSPC